MCEVAQTREPKIECRRLPERRHAEPTKASRSERELRSGPLGMEGLGPVEIDLLSQVTEAEGVGVHLVGLRKKPALTRASLIASVSCQLSMSSR